MKEFIDNYVKKEIDKNNRIKSIVSNDEYMIWLEKFTSIHSNFCDDYWQNKNDSLSEEDIKNVKNLNILFEAISNYANDNFIEPVNFSLGEYYHVKFNDNIYQIGIMTWEGTLYFCDRIKKCNKKYIEFKDIQSSNKIKNTDLMKNRLETLSESIICISEEVPLKAITETTNNTIQKILIKKKIK